MGKHSSAFGRRLALIAIAAIGCASSHGDALMGRGAFGEAAAAYDVELASAPGNANLERKRIAARQGAVRAKLDQARAVRTSGHGEAALSILAEALRLETRWSLEMPNDLVALRDAEVAAAGETVEAAVWPQRSAKAPLTSSRRADKLLPLLDHPRLRSIAQKTTAEIAAAGKARCGELSAKPDGQTPYLGRMLVAYCAKFGSPFNAAAGPEQRRGLRVSGRLEHATGPQHQILETWLAEVFRDSPWFAANAPELMPLKLTGAYDARLERRRVVLNAPYTSVTYSVITQGVLGPSATVETASDRVFQYEAEQYDARYSLDATLTLELAAGQPLAVDVKQVDNRRAYQHEVSFPKANVYPQRANLPDVNGWLTGYLAGKKAPMLRKLRSRWVKAYCGPVRFSPEEAARCLRAGERQPAAAQALVGVFGADTEIVLEDLMRPASGQAAAAGGTKTTPEVEEIPRAGGGETI